MRRVISKIKGNKLVWNTFILSTAGVLVGAINFLLHPVLARMMDVATYGEFEALFAIFYIVGVPAATIDVVVKKYVATYLSKGEEAKIHSFFKLCTKYLFIFGLVVSLFFVLGSGYIASYLQMSHYVPVAILGLAILFTLMTAINNGVLHGFQKFLEFSYNNIAGVTAKIILVVALISLGFALTGAVSGVVFSILFVYFFSLWQIRFIFKYKMSEDISIDFKKMFSYSISTFFIMMFITLLFNLDIILVKHYFSLEDAGLYASLALVARIIFFITMSIAMVLFPMAAEAHAKNEDSKKILIKSILLLGVISSIFVVGFFLFSGMIVNILLGSKYMAITNYLGWFALAMFSLSVINLLTQYLLSVGRTTFGFLLALGPISLFILMYNFHRSLWEIVWIINGVYGVTATLLAVYCFGFSKKLAGDELIKR